jgi:hypothetical protein
MEYKIEGIIEKVIAFVANSTRATDEVKIHAVKSVLYKYYNINVSYAVIERRLNAYK